MCSSEAPSPSCGGLMLLRHPPPPPAHHVSAWYHQDIPPSPPAHHMGDGADEIPLSSSQRCPLPSTQRPPGWGRCPSQWGGDGSGLTSSRAASWPHPWVPRRPGPPKSDQGPPPAPVRVPHSWPGGHRYPPSYTSTLPPPHPPFPLTGDPSTCPVLPGTNRHPPFSRYNRAPPCAPPSPPL